MYDIKKNKYSYDENGLRHGEYVIYYDNGRVNYSINFLHDIKHGLWEGYNYDGELLHRGYMNMGRKIGYWYYSYQQNEYYLWLI